MRTLFTFMCVLALGVMGCSETAGTPECQSAEDCNDDEECTTDACVGGACEHAPVADRTGCYGGAFWGVCIGGSCRSLCDTTDDCVDELNECTVATCVSSEYCDYAHVEDGAECAGGTCQSGRCALSGTVLPCTEQGIRNAIAAGGGPYTFDCDGPTTVETELGIVIDNDVLLDGEGLLLLSGVPDALPPDGVVRVRDGITAELRGFVVNVDVSGDDTTSYQGIFNNGTMTITNSTVTNESGSPYADSILNSGGTMVLSNSTVEARIINQRTMRIERSAVKAAIVNDSAALEITNSTVTGTADIAEFAIRNGGKGDSPVTITNSTLSWRGGSIFLDARQNIAIGSSLLDGKCFTPLAKSIGYNIESPGDTCGFDQPTDQVNVSADDLKLEELADNEGPTKTHALGNGSVAIDQIPAVDCEVAEDQRGQPRPETGGTMCDVGAFEVQPAP